MSFTRFHDDEVRIQQQLFESTHTGRYQLDVPGPGSNLPFVEDPSLRLQKWGANLQTNAVNVESDLLGMTKRLGRDPLENEYTKVAPFTEKQSYPTNNPFIEESRASHPAWTYRDLEHPRWEHPWINPQANLEKPFHDLIQTRILEKDYYRPRVSVESGCDSPADPTTVDYYLSGRSMCLGGR
jgi:hypothetical protein